MFPSTHDVIWAIVLILDILAIISVLRGYGSTAHKLLWTLVILLLPVIGLLLYFILGRNMTDKPLTR
jgi:hypothetical protein